MRRRYGDQLCLVFGVQGSPQSSTGHKVLQPNCLLGLKNTKVGRQNSSKIHATKKKYGQVPFHVAKKEHFMIKFTYVSWLPWHQWWYRLWRIISIFLPALKPMLF